MIDTSIQYKHTMPLRPNSLVKIANKRCLVTSQEVTAVIQCPMSDFRFGGVDGYEDVLPDAIQSLTGKKLRNHQSFEQSHSSQVSNDNF